MPSCICLLPINIIQSIFHLLFPAVWRETQSLSQNIRAEVFSTLTKDNPNIPDEYRSAALDIEELNNNREKDESER